jgi:tubulin beta
MGTKFLEVVCNEHGTVGGGEFCGDNDAQLDRINVLYHEASDGKYVPGVIDAAILSRRAASSSARATS